jgi:hypothetical protein
MAVPRFWRSIPNRYNLLGTHCRTCGGYYYPPRELCPECRRKSDIVKHEFKGIGEIITYTVVHSSSSSFKGQTPYVLAIVQLDEGPRLTSQIKCSPEEIFIGMRVCAVFRKIGEESERGIIYYGTKFVPIDAITS